jgi:hypothetical protein
MKSLFGVTGFTCDTYVPNAVSHDRAPSYEPRASFNVGRSTDPRAKRIACDRFAVTAKGSALDLGALGVWKGSLPYHKTTY